jgi:hypothetical protein
MVSSLFRICDNFCANVKKLAVIISSKKKLFKFNNVSPDPTENDHLWISGHMGQACNLNRAEERN